MCDRETHRRCDKCERKIADLTCDIHCLVADINKLMIGNPNVADAISHPLMTLQVKRAATSSANVVNRALTGRP